MAIGQIGSLLTSLAPATGPATPFVAGIGGIMSMFGSAKAQEEQNKLMRREARRLEDEADKVLANQKLFTSKTNQQKDYTRIGQLSTSNPEIAQGYRQELSGLTSSINQAKQASDNLATQYRSGAAKLRTGQQAFDFAGAGFGLASLVGSQFNKQKEQQRYDKLYNRKEQLLDKWLKGLDTTQTTPTEYQYSTPSSGNLTRTVVL